MRFLSYIAGCLTGVFVTWLLMRVEVGKDQGVSPGLRPMGYQPECSHPYDIEKLTPPARSGSALAGRGVQPSLEGEPERIEFPGASFPAQLTHPVSCGTEHPCSSVRPHPPS